jgi:CheY-like chemotaxis protein
LPRHTEALAPAAKAPAPTLLTGHETILVVDDETLVRNLSQKMLESWGYKVLAAEDGPRALDIVRGRTQPIDLIILDGSMPRLSGRDTLVELAKADAKVPVLFSSGYAVEQHALGDFPQVVGYLNKPYRMDELAKKIREVLDRAAKSGLNNSSPPT